MSNPLVNKAMLAHLRIKAWTATRKIDGAAQVAHAHFSAEHDAGRYTAQLIAKPALRQIQKADTALREYHARNTLPWDNGGARLLTTAHHAEYSENMALLLRARESAVADFVANYPAAVSAAARRLGNLFQAFAYPEPGRIARKYSATVDCWPFPHSEDFRVDLPAAEIARMKEAMDVAQAGRIEDAQAELWGRLREVVAAVAERLTVPAGDNGGTFRDSLIDNVRDAVALLPRLNLTGDPALAQAIAAAAAGIAPADPERLRKDPAARASVAAEARSLLDRVAQYAPAPE